MRLLLVVLLATAAFAEVPAVPPSPSSTVKPRWAASVELVKRAPLTVRLSIVNVGDKVLSLDKPSVCVGGALSNDVFRVSVDGKPVQYRGMMAKRAPPKDFERLKPGQRYSVVVDLSQDYPVPETGALTVRFETTNHFSPDDGVIRSDELVVPTP